MKQRIYIDTSVIGGCLDKEFSEWSLKLFKEFKSEKKIPVISDITLDEISLANENVQGIINELIDQNVEYVLSNPASEELAQAYLKEGAITKKYSEDAYHIAIATISKVDVLVSWNFKHIVNLDRIRKYNAVNLKLGYSLIEIRSPREILYIESK